jgi:dihydrofolate reductase
MRDVGRGAGDELRFMRARAALNDELDRLIFSYSGEFVPSTYRFGRAVRFSIMTTEKTVPRRLFVSMIVSLDGFIEGPHRELDWFEDGDPHFERYCDEMIDSVGLALYGRRSYELMLRYWPNAELNPESPASLAFARKMNALPKLVLSRTLERAEWNNTQIVSDRVAERITELKQQPGKPIVAWAGADLVKTLGNLGLVDEYRLIVTPVLLGGGTPMFQGIEQRRKLKLTRTTQLGRSLAVLCYEPLAP